jgi:type IV secretory pathway VirB6-like protein
LKAFILKIIAKYTKYISTVIIFTILSSCHDHGCIEADDYGQYQTETLTIYPISKENSCEYSRSNDPNAISIKNSDLRDCIKIGDPDVKFIRKKGDVYEDDTTSNNNGCLAEDNPYDTQACIDACIKKCFDNISSGSSRDYEPSRQLTTQRSKNMNYGVTIRPGAEIYIRAKGEVFFGSKEKTNSTSYVDAAKDIPNSFSDDNLQNRQILDIDKKSYKFIFSGMIDDKANTITTTEKEKLRNFNNMGRRIMIYLDNKDENKIAKHRFSCAGDECTVGFDDTEKQPIELSVGLLYDFGGIVRTKQCMTNYFTNKNEGNENMNISEFCISDSDKVNIKDTLKNFNENDKPHIKKILTSGSRIKNLHNVPTKYFFFRSEDKSDAQCDLYYKILNNRGQNILTFDNGLTTKEEDTSSDPPQALTYIKKFKIEVNKIPNSSYIETDHNDTTVREPSYKQYQNISNEIILPPGHSIEYDSQDCNDIIALETKLISVNMPVSGFVSFKNDKQVGCKIKGRIINSHSNLHYLEPITDIGSVITITDPNYFEFKQDSDPLYKGIDINNQFTGNLYIRKGQSLLLDPSKCQNLAIYIEKRPAVWCSDILEKYKIDNPDCVKDLATQKCSAHYSGCLEEGSLEYCPQCQKHIDITGGSEPEIREEYEFAKILKEQGNEEDAKKIEDKCKTEYTQNCIRCDEKRLDAAKKPLTSIVSQNICYDLEDYKGAVRNLNADKSLINIRDENKDSNINLLGLKEISTFNGEYGMLKDLAPTINISKARFSDSDTSEYYLVETAPTHISPSGTRSILKYYIIPLLNQQSQQNSSNVKIIRKSNLIGYDGQYMTLKLCIEGETCPNDGSDIIKLDPNSDQYKFNNNGRIEMTSKINLDGTSSCELSQHNVLSREGMQYYCHTEDFHRNAEESDAVFNERIRQYRLSFKIEDPQEKDAICSKDDYISKTFYDLKGGKTVSEQKCVDKYSDNSGSYDVQIKVKNKSDEYAKMIGSVIEPILEIIDGVPDESGEIQDGKVEKTYKNIITDPKYKMIVRISMIMMVTFFGFSYLMGVSELNNKEIMTRVIKIAIIYLFIGENGWEWFNNLIATPFRNVTDQVSFLMASSFDNSSELLDSIKNDVYSDKSLLFSSVDRTFSLIFSQVAVNKITALIFADFFGWVYFIIVAYGILLYIYAVANAVLIYLTAQVFLSILFTLGPIFLLFTLFKQTQDMFDNWISAIISFSLQQIFLLTTLAFFNILMYEIIKLVLNYRICFGPVWIIDLWLVKINLLQSWFVASIPPSLSSNSMPGINNNPESFPSIFSVLFIWIIGSIMGKFIEMMTDIAQQISGGISANSLASGARQLGAQLKGMAKTAASTAMNTDILGLGSVNSNIQRADKYLFNSGKLAKQERREKKANDAKKASNSRTLKKAADKAEDKFKRENAAQLAGMDHQDQINKIREVREQGMNDKGKDLGLDQKEIDELKDFKGAKYRGDHAFGFAINSAMNYARGDSKSINKREEKIDPALNKSQFKEAINAGNKENRDKILKAVTSGDLKVESTAMESAAKDIKNAIKAPTYHLYKAVSHHRSGKSDKRDEHMKKIGKGAIGVVAAPIKAITGYKPSKIPSNMANSVKTTANNIAANYKNIKPELQKLASASKISSETKDRVARAQADLKAINPTKNPAKDIPQLVTGIYNLTAAATSGAADVVTSTGKGVLRMRGAEYRKAESELGGNSTPDAIKHRIRENRITRNDEEVKKSMKKDMPSEKKIEAFKKKYKLPSIPEDGNSDGA